MDNLKIGTFNGLCNVESCRKPGATFTTYKQPGKYFCKNCAEMIDNTHAEYRLGTNTKGSSENNRQYKTLVNNDSGRK